MNLFGEERTEVFFEKMHQRIFQHIDGYSKSELLEIENLNDEIEKLVYQYCIREASLFKQGMKAPVFIFRTLSNDDVLNMSNGKDIKIGSEPWYTVQFVKYSIPIKGNKELLRLTPRNYECKAFNAKVLNRSITIEFSPPLDHISNGVIRIIGDKRNELLIEKQFENLIIWIENKLDEINNECREFNKRMPDIIHSRFECRLQNTNKSLKRNF